MGASDNLDLCCRHIYMYAGTQFACAHYDLCTRIMNDNEMIVIKVCG